MTNEKLLEIQAASTAAVKDMVKAQIKAGSPNKGITKTRHMAIVADVAEEMLASFGPTDADKAVEGFDESKWNRKVLRAAFSNSILNASQLRQDLEKADILVKETTLSSEYGVD